jgi:hypothetical protein
METESSLRNVVSWKINRAMFLDKDRTMDNVQKLNIRNIFCCKVTAIKPVYLELIAHLGSPILNSSEYGIGDFF